MAITTFSSRQFNQDTNKARKAAMAGPVFITDHGHPAHVLLTYDEYKKLTSGRTKIADLLAMPGSEDIELEIPRMCDVAQSADLS